MRWPALSWLLVLVAAALLPVLPGAAGDDGDEGKGRDRDRDGHDDPDGEGRGGDGEGDDAEEHDGDEGDEERREGRRDRGKEEGRDHGDDGTQDEAEEQGGDKGKGRGKGRDHAKDKDRHPGDSDGRQDEDQEGTSGEAARPEAPDTDLGAPLAPPAPRRAPLSVEQRFTAGPALLTYTLTIRHDGPGSAPDARLQAALPVAGDWLVTDPRCTVAESALSCRLGDLAPGAVQVVQAQTPAAGPLPAFTNVAQVYTPPAAPPGP